MNIVNEPLMNLDFIHALAFSGVRLFIGYGLCRFVRPLARYNIPAPVVSGLLVALTVLVFRRFGMTPFQFDTTLRDPLMICFFTTIGFGASFWQAQPTATRGLRLPYFSGFPGDFTAAGHFDGWTMEAFAR